MPSDNKQLTITIGATLSAAFNSVISGSTSKLNQVGTVIKGLEKQSTLSATAIGRLKTQYNSLLGSINRQQAILNKRADYQSQIMDVITLGASLAAPINSAMKFESAMADVHKVVNIERIVANDSDFSRRSCTDYCRWWTIRCSRKRFNIIHDERSKNVYSIRHVTK